MESRSNQQKVENKFKNMLYLRFFKVATLCFGASFEHSLHSLNQLHEVVIWNAVQLTGVPCSKLIRVIYFLLNAFEPISCVVTR